MKQYVISVAAEGQKKYVFIDTQAGISRGVDTKAEATVLPNRAVAVAVVTAIRPAIKKNKLNCVIKMEVM
ncbi:MAG: hypothetical protein IJO56_06365 [Oscillospiraceae bacterium]|nr:hypothetical protein [Oscillospiraceae bacterium]